MAIGAIAISELDDIEIINEGGESTAIFIKDNELILVIAEDICEWCYDNKDYQYICHVDVDFEMLPDDI